MQLFGTSLENQPPLPEQVEVTVIGPSFGESICVHPGGGRWWIIDSCLNPDTRTVAAIDYLHSMGVDLEAQVDLLIATHWHDDHCGGLAQLLAACPQARFCSSSALATNEFRVLIAQYQSNPPAVTGSRLKEFDSVLRILRDTKRVGRKAEQGKLLHRLEPDLSGHGQECLITSISPSDYSSQVFIQQFAALLPEEREAKRPIPSLSPNEASVALWIDIGETKVLLGGDLESSSDHRRGWKAYLAADNCPLGLADLVKIPHHGSTSAHDEQLWRERIVPRPFSITTPWELGGHSLPSPADIVRIRSQSGVGMVTARPDRARPRKRARPVMKELKGSDVKLRAIPVGLGAVRCRTSPQPGARPWCLEFFGSAFTL